MKLIILVIALNILVQASSTFSCFTEFIVDKGKNYKPPENFKEIFIRFSDDKNVVIFKTQNGQSHYNYKSFVSPSNSVQSIGVSYEADGKYLDIFNNNYLYFGFLDKGLMLKAFCPKMNLNIKEMDRNAKGQIIYGFK